MAPRRLDARHGYAVRLAGIAPLAFLAASCAPGPDIDPATHQQYLVYDWNADTRTYELHASKIETLTDPRAIAGTVAELRGGGSLVIANSNPQTKEDYEGLLKIRGDKTPSAEYFVDGDVVVPFDFDTQLMVTLYHHLERADQYFVGLGVEPVGRLKTYYFPQFSIFGFQLPLLTDNAAYATTLDAFLIPPTVSLVDDVPLSANRGVIVHEYSHAVFNRLVDLDDRAPEQIWDTSYPAAARDQIRSLDEGIADVFGALATGDSNFIGPSISKEIFGLDRDLAVKRTWNRELQDEIDESPAAAPNPYLLGSVVASSLWSTRDFLTDEEVALTTISAMKAIADPPPEFRLVDFLNEWLNAVKPTSRDATCEIFTARFPLVASELECG